MNLYICLTYYHVLIAVIKAQLLGGNNDILVANDIPGYEDLCIKLKNSNVFNNVLIYDAKNIRIKKAPSNVKYSLSRSKYNILRIFKRFFKENLKKYDNIYLFNDATEIGLYLIYSKTSYHLLEDALDFFKYFDKYYHLKEGTYDKNAFKYKVKKTLGIGFLAWGTSKFCIDIEVNDLDGIHIPSDKVVVVSRKDLFNRLTKEHKVKIYSIFASGKTVSDVKGEKVLVCTQPLFQAGHVDSEEKQLIVFESIVSDYTSKGYHVVIKAHPRDEVDYSKIILKYNCDTIDKNLPSEVLDYNPNAQHFFAAIAITSTSINSLECAENKYFLGMEYVDRVLHTSITE